MTTTGPVIIRRLPPDTPIPADATRYIGEPVAVVADRLWLLLATRRHPATNEINALLRAPDGSAAAVAPAWAVSGIDAPDIQLAKQEAGIAPPQPGTAGTVRPNAPDPHRQLTTFDLTVARFAAAFDGSEINLEEPINV